MKRKSTHASCCRECPAAERTSANLWLSLIHISTMKRKSDEGFFTILGLIVLSLMLSFAQLLTQRAAALHKLAGACLLYTSRCV